MTFHDIITCIISWCHGLIWKLLQTLINHNEVSSHARVKLVVSRNILTVYDINKLQTLCFVYKAVNILLPKHFNTFFNLNINIHQHNTRQSSSLHFTFHRTNIRANSIKILDPKLWNSLGFGITSLPSFHIFKNHCFHSILNSYVQLFII